MNSVKIVILVVIAAFLGAGLACAMQHEASIEKGKSLFNDSKLGTTGKTCNDCHPDGKGVENSAGKKDIEKIINACITQPLKGKALDVKSVEMQSIIKYIDSVGGAKKKHAKKAPVGC